MTRFFRAIAFLIFGVNPALAEWTIESAALGARDHPKVLQRFGGAIQNPNLSTYVAGVGARLVAVSKRADEAWAFTVLDSDQVNAFALPGGYIYVTRGLLALANNESELAAVLAHEITHVIEEHVEARQAAQSDALVDGAVSALVAGVFGGGENRVGDAVRQGVETAFGQMGTYSKEQEFEADAGGVGLLRAAGYRPAAQADFLGSMVANATLSAALAGRVYDETKAPLFANHPAPAERQLRALALAANGEGKTERATYFSVIDGMVYGQSHRGGFVRGRRFIHPSLGFDFSVPAEMRIQNGARQINILGPNRSTLIVSGGRGREDLVAGLQAWAAEIPRRDRQNRTIVNVRLLDINGLEAASGSLRLRKRGQRFDVQMTVIRFGGGIIRFAGTVRRGDDEAAALQWETVQSFAQLSEEGAAEYAQSYIRAYRVAEGETVAELIQRAPVSGFSAAEFRVLNGLGPDDELPVGMLVKLVSY